MLQCSESCGTSGISRRQAFCRDRANRRLDDRACEQAIKDKTEKECNRMPCPKWVYGAWAEVNQFFSLINRDKMKSFLFK